jgi:hypothetical protein
MDWWLNEHFILATEFHRVARAKKSDFFKNRISQDFEMDWWLNEHTEFHRVARAKKSDFFKK